MNQQTKPNWPLLAIGGLFLLPPGWTVFHGLMTVGETPAPIALLAIFGLIATAIALVYLALQNVAAGDVRQAEHQILAAGVLMIAEVIGQFWFAATLGHPMVTALILGGLSIGGALIVEGELMRHQRATGRANGVLTLARAQVPAEVRREFPDVAGIAKRTAIRFPNATQESILKHAFAEWDEIEAARAKNVETAQVRVDVSDLITPSKAVSSGRSPEASAIEADARPDDTGGIQLPNGEVLALSGSVSAQVKALMAAGVDEPDGIVSAILRTNPGTKEDTVRRNIRKIRTAPGEMSA